MRKRRRRMMIRWRRSNDGGAVFGRAYMLKEEAKRLYLYHMTVHSSYYGRGIRRSMSVNSDTGSH
jgi:predicted GNAT family acetyltransferase